jgi:hypothetical protein
MKKIGSIISILAIFLQGTAFAWIGGPYSGNTYDGFTNGNYRYTIRAKHLNGIAKFAENNSSPFVSEFGDSVVYFKGTAYYGESYGSADFDAKSISGVFNASVNGAGGGFGAQLGDNSSDGSHGVSNGPRADLSDVGALAQRAVINGEWTGRFTRTSLTARFKGKGRATVLGNGDTVGSRLVSIDTGFTATNPPNPNANTTQTQTTFTISNAASPTDTVKIRVQGSRVSLAPGTSPIYDQFVAGN